MVERQKTLSQTNASEAKHRSIFKGIPKSMTCCRNVFGRAHVQILRSDIGIDAAIKKVCTSANVPLELNGPGLKRLQSMANRDSYFSARAKTRSAKRARHINLNRNRAMKNTTGSAYKTDQNHPMIRDHMYSQNIYKLLHLK